MSARPSMAQLVIGVALAGAHDDRPGDDEGIVGLGCCILCLAAGLQLRVGRGFHVMLSARGEEQSSEGQTYGPVVAPHKNLPF